MDDEDVLFQDFLYKLKQPKSRRFHRLVQQRWKMKYFALCCHDDQLVLKYYNKKPKHQLSSSPKAQINLCPSFKVEKHSNCYGRAFVVELTAPDQQVSLSAEDQSTVDKLVFLMMTQIRLRDNITDNLVEVKTDLSEAFARIGAKGANCVLHVSPWGLTLIFKKSRAVVAQWPLKSIRYYESSGQGQFTVEAGMVAPMGEGIFHFHTLQGSDNRLYDTVDHYVINTLDRVKPNQRGTPEEIQDYIREFDCLHSLTVLTPTSLTGNPEVAEVLRDNWSSSLEGPNEVSASQRSGGGAHPSSADTRSAGPDHVPSVRQLSTSSSVPSPSFPPTPNRANHPLPIPQSPRSGPSLPSSGPEQQRHSPQQQRQRDFQRQRGSPATAEEGRMSKRPPLPLPHNGVPRVPKTPPRSARQDRSAGAAAFPHSAEQEPRRHSNPAAVALRVTPDMDIHPAIRKQMSYDSSATPMLENSLLTHQRPPDSPQLSPIPSPSEGSEGRSSCPVPSVTGHVSGADQAAGSEHKLDAPVEDWLVSASCEDLSDHMRAVIFEQRKSQRLGVASASARAPSQKQHSNNNDPDFIPPPFQNIVGFRSGAGSDRNYARDRSMSFDVNSKMHKTGVVQNGTGNSPASPSIKQIRKMVSARTVTKETLRKSLSNPNYLNLGSKEKLYQQRVQTMRSTQRDQEEASKLSAYKHKSRSLASLLPSTLRRYISKESISQAASASPSPDMRHSRSGGTPTQGLDRSNFPRQNSARSLREMSIKGIHFTDQSRSFRRPKGYQRSRSAEPNLRTSSTQDGSGGGDNSQIAQDNVVLGLRSSAEVEKASADDGDVDRSSIGRNSEAHVEADRKAETGAVNGVLPPEGEGKLRLPSQSASQSTC